MHKSPLLDQMLELEKEYVGLFSGAIENDGTMRYIDSALPDMHTHNFIWYNSKQGLGEFVTEQIEKHDTKEKGFFRIETPYPISSKLIESFPVKPKICTYDLMYIETNKFSQLKGNLACNIFSAEDHKVLEDGMNVDIIANQTEMGLDFAQRRINRKAKVYSDNNKEIQFFVCYCDGVPIGSIEYMPFNGMIKLEDFDIIEEHQRKGFGTFVLKHLLEIAYNDNIEIAYLITDSADTAKEMYKKNGFMKIGEKTELLFFLE